MHRAPPRNRTGQDLIKVQGFTAPVASQRSTLVSDLSDGPKSAHPHGVGVSRRVGPTPGCPTPYRLPSHSQTGGSLASLRPESNRGQRDHNAPLYH